MLAIAPEGKVTDGKTIYPFRTGAFLPLRPIQPILFRFPHKYASPTWVGDLRWVMYMLYSQFVNHASIELLPLVYSLKDETPRQFSERVREIMLKELHTYSPMWSK